MTERSPSQCDSSQPATYGGQAVIEGVMMRNRERLAIAVRRPDGGITVKTEPVAAIYRSRWAQVLFVRGLFTLWDSLVLGTKALMFSADVAAGEEEEISSPLMWGTIAVSFILGLVIFFALPAWLSVLVHRVIHNDLLTNFVEGVIRLGIFLIYLVLISRMEDIQRVFAYHGAEHRTINAYEAGAPLTIEGVRAYSTSHTRCGTGFLLIVVLVSVVVFSFFGRPSLPILLASRLLLIPLIAAVSYELVRLSARNQHTALGRAFVVPALSLQRLTTRQPDDSMLEVAITALNHVLHPELKPAV